MSAKALGSRTSRHETDEVPVPTPDAPVEDFWEPPRITMLEGDLIGALDADTPGWWLLEPMPRRRFPLTARPYISRRVALSFLGGLLGGFAFGAVLSHVVIPLLYAYLPPAGTAMLSVRLGPLRLENELMCSLLAAMLTIHFVRIEGARSPLVYFLSLLVEINVLTTLELFLLS